MGGYDNEIMDVACTLSGGGHKSPFDMEPGRLKNPRPKLALLWGPSASTTVRMKWLEIPYVCSHIVREQFRQRALALNKSTL